MSAKSVQDMSGGKAYRTVCNSGYGPFLHSDKISYGIRIDEPAIFGCSMRERQIEGVLIDGPGINKNPYLGITFLKFTDLRGVKRFHATERHCSGGFSRIYRGVAEAGGRRLGSAFCHLEVVWQGQAADEHNPSASEVLGWRRASIDESQRDDYWLGQIKLHDSRYSGMDVSAQLSNRNITDNEKRQYQSKSLETADNYTGDANFFRVLVRRALLLICSIAAGFGLALWSGMSFDNERPLFSAGIVTASVGIPLVGWCLFGATLWHGSLGWWL